MLDASLRWHDSLKHGYDFLSHERRLVSRIIKYSFHLFNSSKSYVTLYVKHATADEKITILSPYQSQVFTTHCFNEEYLIAKLMHQNRRGQWVEGQRYKTLKQYTVVNALPFVTFPDNFRETLNYSWD